MKIVKTINEVRKIVNSWKSQGYSIGLVPTMGFLHEGHQSLIKNALENDRVIVSIFLNPMQFTSKEELENYPRDLQRDCSICEENGVNIVFAPELDEMFSEGFCSYVDTSILTEGLFGVNSCDYYRGFCTVTTKLFNITSADRAYFGQKDAQHLAVIRRLVKDLNMKLSIIGCPVIREEDGLAITSKNTFLNAEERRAALILSKTIRLAQGLVQAGEKDTEGIIEAMRENIGTEPLARIDYIEIVDAETMQRVDTIDGQVLVAIAVYIGDIRLLDNFTT